MNVCVVALGKIGLPLAVQFARSGLNVVGADIDVASVEKISGGEAPFPGEAHLETLLPEVIASGLFRATTNTQEAVANSDVVVVVVPLVVDDLAEPEFTALDSATRAIAAGLRPGSLVIYETTLPVGTTRQRFAPMLAEGSGLTLGTDLFVAFSPERVYSGRIFSDLRKYPKLVGGIDETSTQRAIQFYEQALQFDDRDDLAQPNGVWNLRSTEAAELAKLAETTYRDVNIAFANELAKFADAHGIDVMDVIDSCNSQPFSHIHRPGIAVGGHCIPVYPRFYLQGDATAQLPSAARSVNDAMPAYAVHLLENEIGPLRGLRIAVLGAAYRGGVKETAFSGVFATVAALLAHGADPVVHDPLYTDQELRGMGFHPYHFGEPCAAAIVQAEHVEYDNLDTQILGGATVVLDGRKSVNNHPDLTIITIGGGSHSTTTRVHSAY